MKPMRVLPAVLLAAAIMLGGAPSASPKTTAGKPVEEGCFERDWGYRCWYGPIHVVPEKDSEQDVMLVPTIPEAGYITSLYATLVDPYNSQTDHHAAHLHHAVLGNPNRTDATCGDMPFFDQVDRFFATGKERSKMVLPEGYGYYWDNQMPPDTFLGSDYVSEPTWVLIHHFHTMIKDYETDVYLRADFGFTAAEEGAMTDITPIWLDVNNCGDSTFDVDKGDGKNNVTVQPWDYTMPMSGQFIAFGGHLHDGGLKLRLDNSTAGSKMFVSRPTYSETHKWDLQTMSTYSAYPGVHVTAGDNLLLRAFYDSHKDWHDVMGIMIGAFVPDPV